MGIETMTYLLKRKILAAGAAGLFALGLAACGDDATQQQSSNPAAPESSDAAATPESTTPEGTTNTPVE